MGNLGNIAHWKEFAGNKRLCPSVWHYFEIKLFHTDRLLLYRVGDFFVSYLGDAVQLAQALELRLLSKETGNPLAATERIPMCGFPAHALKRYSNHLAEQAIKVAIVDFVQDQRFEADTPWFLIPRTTTFVG